MGENLIIGSSVLTALATCGLVAVAYIQLGAIRKSTEEPRKPYVFAIVHKDTTREGKDGIYLSLTNYGESVATDITLKIAANPWKAIGNRAFAFEQTLGIAALPPGVTLSYLLGPASGALLEAYSAPGGVRVSVKYSSAFTGSSYSESFTVSLLDSYGAKGNARTK